MKNTELDSLILQSMERPAESGSSKEKPKPAEDESRGKVKKPVRPPRNIVPIIMCLALALLLAPRPLSAQMEVDVSLETSYTDNVFQLSEHDLDRWAHFHQNLDYVNTTDDLKIGANFDIAYPIRYQWWKFVPSVSATISQNISNPAKHSQNAVFSLRTERYYWNLTALYGYYPDNYVRSYIDRDGTGELEDFTYSRNLYRADLNLKPIKNTTLQLHGRYEEYFYNQYWTEFDANAATVGIGARYSFPSFSMGASYRYRSSDNHRHGERDASYNSNRYAGDIRLKSTPLSSKAGSPTFHPEFSLSYEERFYQSNDTWYGGRADFIYNTKAALNFGFGKNWKLKLDYSHAYRNIVSPVESVRRSKEYSENRISATVKYSF